MFNITNTLLTIRTSTLLLLTSVNSTDSIITKFIMSIAVGSSSFLVIIFNMLITISTVIPKTSTSAFSIGLLG